MFGWPTYTTEKSPSIDEIGSVVRIVTVSGSGVVTSSMGRMTKLNGDLAFAFARSMVPLTASEVKASPLLNFTPERSLNVQVLPSGDVLQLSARRGTILSPLGENSI